MFNIIGLGVLHDNTAYSVTMPMKIDIFTGRRHFTKVKINRVIS